MYFKESTASSRVLTTDHGNKFYIRDHRVKLPKRKETTNNESRISSQSSIYGHNNTIEDSIEKSLDRIKPSRNELKERPCYPNEHVQIQAEGKLKCPCPVCIAQNQLRTEPDDVVPDPFFARTISGLNGNVVSLDEGYMYVLRKLLPPRNSSQGLTIKVPETLVYMNGEARFIVMTAKDKTMKFMNQREKLAQHEIRKFFNDRFVQKDEEQRLVDSKNALESRNWVLTSQDVGMTERTQGIDLRRGTPSGPGGMSTGRSARQRIAKSLSKNGNQNREVALVKFNDDSTTILCEAEFENLITKKKFDPYWKNIAFIQNYRGFSKYIHTLKKVYFVYDREKDNPLFYRASREAHQINGGLSPASDHYISPHVEDEFQQILKSQNEDEYCLYVLMKIFHFVQVVHGIKIIKMCGDFVKDALDILYLTNISRLQYQMKHAENENYLRGVSTFRFETEEKSSIECNETFQDMQRREDIEVLTDLMQKQYDNMKSHTGIKEVIPNYQEDISDNIFSQLHPNAPHKLSKLLKSGPNYSTRQIPSEASLQANGPVRGVYLRGAKNISVALNSQNPSVIGPSTSRSTIKSRAVRVRRESTANTSRIGRTLPSLGNVDGNTSANINTSRAAEPKNQGSKKENLRSNSQPNLRKVLKFYGITPGANQPPKALNETFRDHQARILKRGPSEIFTQVPKISKISAVDGDCFTDRCTPDATKTSTPNTPYVIGLRGLSRGVQDKLTSQLDQGSSTRRSQSVNKRALGYILNN